MHRRTFVQLCAATSATSLALPSRAAAVGDTRIARWQDDKRAAFLLMFDDSWPSHFQVAAPELARRGLTGTFYINPGKGEYLKFKDEWEQKLWRQGMVYGNHTLTHKGAETYEDAAREIGECTKAILAMVPGKQPRLLSWGMPGVPKWAATAEQMAELLARDHLISRGDFRDHGAVYHLKTTAEMLALADKAIAKGGMEYLVIHGVERIVPNWSYQDFWALKQDVFLPLLDELKARSDRGDLWITDHISQHQYETERDGATAKVAEASDQRVRVELTSTADAQLYDLPLTLVTRVPAGWRQATVTQGETTATVPVTDGAARYRAVPNAGPVELSAAPAA